MLRTQKDPLAPCDMLCIQKYPFPPKKSPFDMQKNIISLRHCIISGKTFSLHTSYFVYKKTLSLAMSCFISSYVERPFRPLRHCFISSYAKRPFRPLRHCFISSYVKRPFRPLRHCFISSYAKRPFRPLRHCFISSYAKRPFRSLCHASLVHMQKDPLARYVMLH